ncbi:hypothetical protein LZ30DRAFT_368528 [Colletotrichum cereale]|nr:hypothetical protein LZ30DRAFT_368528 [Colletotrichum cereale]
MGEHAYPPPLLLPLSLSSFLSFFLSLPPEETSQSCKWKKEAGRRRPFPGGGSAQRGDAQTMSQGEWAIDVTAVPPAPLRPPIPGCPHRGQRGGEGQSGGGLIGCPSTHPAEPARGRGRGR